MSPAKAAESSMMPFWILTRVGPINYVSHPKGQCWGDDIGMFPHATKHRSHWPYMLSTSVPIGRPESVECHVKFSQWKKIPCRAAFRQNSLSTCRNLIMANVEHFEMMLFLHLAKWWYELPEASPLDPSRGLSLCALRSSFTFSRLDHCQCRGRTVDWALQADTRDHALQRLCRPPQQRDSWHRHGHRHSWSTLRSL